MVSPMCECLAQLAHRRVLSGGAQHPNCVLYYHSYAGPTPVKIERRAVRPLVKFWQWIHGWNPVFTNCICTLSGAISNVIICQFIVPKEFYCDNY